MVGKGDDAASRQPDREPRRGAATRLSGAGRGARGGRRARLPGRRRRPRPAARPRPRRPRPRRRVGDAAALAAAARRRGASSTSASAPPRSSSTATRSTSPAPAPRPTRIPARCPMVEPGRRASRPTSAAATSRSTRWRSRSPASRRLIDPHGGAADLEARPAAGPAPALLRRRPDPGDPRRPLRRPARLRARAGDRASCCARPTSTTVSADRREAELLRLAGEASAPAGLRAARRVGADRACATGGIELAGAVAELLAGRRAGAASTVRDAGPCRLLARGAAARPWRRGRAGRRRSPQRLSQAVELARRPRPGRAGPRPGARRRVARPATWREWRAVALEIDGADLIAAGVPEGPALGRGLEAALRRKLDGEIAGRERGAGRGAGGRPRRGLLSYRMEWRERERCALAGGRTCGGARAAFSTRLGGVSEAPFDSLNLGVLTDDDDDAVVENRAPLAAALGLEPGAIADRPPGPRRRARGPHDAAGPEPVR